MPTTDDYLKLAQSAVDGPMNDHAPPGWTKVAQSALDAGKMAADGDYYGAAYKGLETAELVVANVGGPAWLADGIKDAEQMMQAAPGILRQLEAAQQFMDQVIAEFPGDPISFVGAALGGAAAQAQAALLAAAMGEMDQLGALAASFGGPGAAQLVDALQGSGIGQAIANYVVPGDLLGLSGTHIGDLQVVTPQGLTTLPAAPTADVPAAPGAPAPPAGLPGSGAHWTLADGVLTLPSAPVASYASGLLTMQPPAPPTPGAGMPAARITDMHVCPMVTVLVPHVGGPIVGPCAPTVLIGCLPAARVTDMLVCVGPPDVIVKGSMTVLTMTMPQARITDMTAHGGVIVVGWPTVLVGG